MVALLRFAVLLLLPVISLSLPASDSSDGLELRQALSPAAEIIDILSKSMLPRVQAFGGAASSLDSRSSATDLYDVLRVVRDTSVDSGRIRQLIPEFWTVPLTVAQGTQILDISSKLIGIVSVALPKVDVRVPDVVLARLPLLEIRPLVLMARVSIWKLNPLIDVLQLENWYMEFPAPEQNALALKIREQFQAAVGNSSSTWVDRASLPFPNGRDIAPSLEPWQDVVLLSLDDTVEGAKALKNNIKALTASSPSQRFAEVISADPVSTLSLPYPDQLDLINTATEPLVLDRLQEITTNILDAYQILRDEKYQIIRGWSSTTRTSIMRSWGGYASMDSTSFRRNYINWLLKIIQPNSHIRPQVVALIDNFSNKMAEHSQYAYSHTSGN